MSKRRAVAELERLVKKSFLYFLARKVWFVFEVWSWVLKGRPVPPPRRIKQRIVKQYARRFGLSVFIETGTNFGDMVAATKRLFEKIYSIELDQHLYNRARRVFSKYPHIHLLQGDSGTVLPKLLSSITEPCLFWLDAHYSGGITARGDEDTPVIKELQSILTHSCARHVILLDDARLFTGEGSYPSIDALREFVAEHRPGLVLAVEYDVIRIYRNGR